MSGQNSGFERYSIASRFTSSAEYDRIKIRYPVTYHIKTNKFK